MKFKFEITLLIESSGIEFVGFSVMRGQYRHCKMVGSNQIILLYFKDMVWYCIQSKHLILPVDINLV